MPQLQSLTVNNGEATPVAQTFVPEHIDPKTGVASLTKAGTTPLGDSKITLSRRRTGDKYKLRMVLSVPQVVTETISGVDVPKVVRTAYADVNVTFADTSTVGERKDVLAMMANAFIADQAVIDGLFEDLEGVY